MFHTILTNLKVAKYDTMYLFFAILCFGTVVCSEPMEPMLKAKPIYDLDLLEDHFQKFVETYNKNYRNYMERQYRMLVFRDNLELINLMNSDPEQTATFAVNEFSDLFEEEFMQMYTGFDASLANDDVPLVNLTGPVEGPLPAEFDWRSKGIVSRVKDQARCGSCWAFSSTGAVESAYAKKHGNIVEVSEQQLVDCAGQGGCVGGLPQGALEYLVEKGADSESSYPYTASQGACQDSSKTPVVKVANYRPLSIQNEDALAKELLSNGPLSIAVSAGGWQSYRRGIFTCPRDGINHAVLLVGYGVENKVPYWLIKNSWGPGFGEQGYIKIQRGVNACGIQNNYGASVTTQ